MLPGTVYMSGFMKTLSKNLAPITLISPWFHYSLRLPLSHEKGKEIEKGRHWKVDKRVEKEKPYPVWLSFYFLYRHLLRKKIKRPLKAELSYLTSFSKIKTYILYILKVWHNQDLGWHYYYCCRWLTYLFTNYVVKVRPKGL